MTINNNSIHSQFLKFKSKNFDNWCIQIHVWDLVNIGYNKVTDLKEFKALSKLQKDSLKDSWKK